MNIEYKEKKLCQELEKLKSSNMNLAKRICDQFPDSYSSVQQLDVGEAVLAGVTKKPRAYSPPALTHIPQKDQDGVLLEEIKQDPAYSISTEKYPNMAQIGSSINAKLIRETKIMIDLYSLFQELACESERINGKLRSLRATKGRLLALEYGPYLECYSKTCGKGSPAHLEKGSPTYGEQVDSEHATKSTARGEELSIKMKKFFSGRDPYGCKN